MIFDLTTFVLGVGAGLLTGALAGILHGLEKVSDLQERLRSVTSEVERIRDDVSAHASLKTSGTDDVDSELESLHRDLDEIHEEIRQMYHRSH